MTFAEKLKSIRKKAGLSQEQLAEKLGVSRQAVTKWETETGIPDIENMMAISALFDISIDELLSNERGMKKSDEYLFESVTEYDIDEPKRYDMKFGGAKQTVLTVSAQIDFESRLLFRDTLKPVYKIKERNDVMNEIKNKNLFIRVSEKEKNLIERNAERCGLSVSEYLRQRALGYMPRAVLPEVFFSFNDKLDELCIAVEGKITAETEEKIVALIDEITAELILPQKERLAV